MIFAAAIIGLASSLYTNGLVATTVVRATLLYYLTLFWSTLIGVLWLSERLTKAWVISIIVAFFWLDIAFIRHWLGTGSSQYRRPVKLYLWHLLGDWNCLVEKLVTDPDHASQHLRVLSTTIISAVFTMVIYGDPLPDFTMAHAAFPTAVF